MSFNSVDFPAPFGPSNPVMPPAIVRLISFSPMTWPYHFDKWSVCTTADVRHVTTSMARMRRLSTNAEIAMAIAMTPADTIGGVS